MLSLNSRHQALHVLPFALLPLAIALMTHVTAFSQEQVEPKQEEKYVDDKYEFSITVGAPWKSARLQTFTVPGVARAAYAQPGGSSIVIFLQEPGQAFDPRFLVDMSASSIERSLGATVREKDVKSIDEKKAMWLVVEGKGTGGAIDGKGDVQTTQHWVAIPRKKDVVVALLTSPTSDYDENRKSFEAALKTFQVGGEQTEQQAGSQ
jgi:hypothetical protein